ncbi:MAG: hypothetical protein HYZ74_07725 [Elusimicrobia bacterium]|nr:hypothetical protein [Elusimicrobiota bacterium]
MTILTLLLLAAQSAGAQSTATLRGVDVYRSSVLTEEKARALFGPRLLEYVTLRNIHRPAPDQKAEALRKTMERQAAALPGIARVELSVSEYFTSVDHAMYATFDVVDAADRGRLAFAPAPRRTLPDPDGLLAAWKQYYELGSSLSRRGDLSVDRPDCPGFYCLWGGPTPELSALQNRFVSGAAGKERELRGILANEADADKRASALFVLSYGTNGEKVVAACMAALKDPAPGVRGAALQILADVVNHRKDLRVDVERIAPLLDDPVGVVRGKTMGLLVPMTDDESQRKKLMASAPRLVALLRLHQPDNHDLAFTVLGMLSRSSFDAHDYAKWEAWAQRAAAGKD